MASIASTDEGITGVKPSYQDPLLDTFRELMDAARTFCVEERDAGRITHKEYAMLYLQTLQTCITTSAQLARDAAEQDFKVANLLDLDKQIKEQQVKQLKVEVALKTTQKNQIEQSVYDNRLIKIEGDLADMTGMILNGGTQAVPAGLATSLTNAIATLVAIPKETVTIEA